MWNDVVAEGRCDPHQERPREGAGARKPLLKELACVVVPLAASLGPWRELRASVQEHPDAAGLRKGEAVVGGEAILLEMLPEGRGKIVPTLAGHPALGRLPGHGCGEGQDKKGEVRRHRVRGEKIPVLREVRADGG